mmetsp:Transcript_5890/g.8772  ORF Transcript_5890/g.8772 Transcript_5890/m.8772 type:complete len:221 (+) Transcript_5890:335-997(+)
MSTTTRDSASSSGHSAEANRLMFCRLPSAKSKASPRANAQSSAVWWSSMCKSPLQVSWMSKRPCLASCEIMWSRNPSPVCTSHTPLPSKCTVTSILVSLVLRCTSPLLKTPCGTKGAAGMMSSSWLRPHRITPSAWAASRHVVMSSGGRTSPSVTLASSSGVRTPHAKVPPDLPALISSGVSPIINALQGSTPNFLQAINTPVGLGLAGASSIHMQILNK